MRKFLLSLVFAITAIAAQAQDPAVTMTTTTPIGSNFSFSIAATANGTPIQVDWGNGTLVNYTIGLNNSDIFGILSGSTVSIYGVGISILRFESVLIITLDVSKCSSLSSLTCQYCYDLTNVELSNAITSLWLVANKLTYIDVSQNSLLEYLTISQSPISSIDISKNTKLKSLSINHTNINNIDLSNNLSLITFSCSYSKITSLDLSKNILLRYIYCDMININALDVSNNMALTRLECNGNQLTVLDVSKNTALTYLCCQDNKLKFATLPIKQATWTTYTYSPQAKIALAKKEYSVNEDIDLSSQLTAGGNTTTYVWKTIGGITLVKDVDYTESNGKFTFKAPPVGYFYCEMKNATFPDLTLTTGNIFITPTTPAIIMTTANSVGTTLSFELDANENNNSIHIDWGNGVLYNYTIQSNWTSVSGTLTGNTVKIYGWEIDGLFTSNINLTNLDVTNCFNLKKLWCSSNKLTFATLPIKQASWTSYSYSFQAKLTLPKTEYTINEEVDLSSQLTAGGNTTDYVWKTASGITLVKNVDYTESNGKFIFKTPPVGYLYCEMKNTTFPNLTLTTENIYILPTAPGVVMTTTTTVGSNFYFTIGATANNVPIKVDWGNGALTSYTVRTSLSTVSGTLTGNTIKIYGVGINYIGLYDKKLTSLDVTKNTELTKLYCDSNQLTALDVTQNTALTTLNSSSNKLTFATLPIKQASWTTYTYSPQAKFPLPKLEYAINEEIDLSSQLVAGGNTTAYVWKTMKGITLFKNVDYSENNGIFVFLKAYSDSVYCEMTNATFPELTLITKNIATYLSLPTISMVSASAIGSNFFFDISAKENTPITVDFGNGLLSSYIMGINSSRIEGKLIGDTIKVWGVDIEYISISWMELTSLNVSNALNLKSLHCNFNQLTNLDISKNIQLDHLYCNNNQLESLDLSNNINLQYVYNQNNYLTFATLPLINSSWFDFSYSPQFPIKMEKAEYSIGETLDLSSQLSVNGTVTTYAWVTSSGNTLTKDVDYVENNGKFTFLKGQTETIYCQMTNATFPSLVLKTISITISPTPSVIMTTTKAIGSTLLFEVSAEVFNTPIIVDWGNGTLMNYTIGANSTSISGILAGNTIKIFGDSFTSIIVTQNQLTSLDVTNAPKLTRLYCYSNLLTNLDVTKNNKLQQFMCGSNQLTNLDVTQNTELKELSCSSNLISSLDVSQNIKMTELICSSNLLTSLDVSKNILLQILWCDANKLSGLDLSQNTELNKLLCHSNELINLDVSNNTMLQELWCETNQLTNLDVSKNTLLKNLLCNSNLLTSLDVSKNSELQKLLCSSNHIASLNVSNNYALTTLTCESNLLTFSTLPIKQATWTTYYYAPQGEITLPKVEYEINEEIDLSNQLTISGNTTVYKWKTAGGVELVKNQDYTESNGKFTFLMQPWDYFYCEMRNSTYPNLILKTKNISIALSEPIMTMTTLTPLNNQFDFILRAKLNNQNVKIDWGNGVLNDFAIGTNNSDISGNLAGNTIKIYGLNITYADVSEKNLTNLAISNPILSYLNCNSNNLTFATLPLKQQNWTTYTYSPQANINLPKKQYGLTETVDLSSELTIDGKTTNYIWKTKSGATLTAGTDFSVTGGVTTFLKVQTDSVYCQMTNATFPDLTLSTTNIKVSQFPLSVTQNEVAVKVFPNPASDNFSVEMAEEIVRVEVYTITGVKVFENNLYNSTKVNVLLTNMPKGTLIVRAFTRNGVYESKVIKI